MLMKCCYVWVELIIVSILINDASTTVVPCAYELEQEWEDGFLAKISLPIAKRFNYGWLLYIKYQNSVVELDVFEAELVDAHPNSKEYVFRNKDYNAVIYYYKDKIFHLYLQGNQYPSGDKTVYQPPPDAEVIFVAYETPSETVAEALRRVDELPTDQRKPVSLKTTTASTTPASTQPTTRQTRTTTTTTRLPWLGWRTPPINILLRTSPTTIPLTTRRKTPAISKSFRHNLRDVIKKSLLFYAAQRSGYLPNNYPIPWRSHSALRDGSDKGIDLTGGYYTDGGHVKYGFPTASALSILSWGAIEFKRGYVASKELGNLLAAIKWGTDYILKCHTSPHQFYAQVSNEKTDNTGWMRPEDIRGVRPSYAVTRSRPGSDVAAESAAALAAASIALRATNPVYAAKLVNESISLLRFADRYRGKYQDAVATSKYKSSGYFDEIAWAAGWLYGVTKETKYLDLSIRRLAQHQQTKQMKYLDWDDKQVAVVALLAQMTNRTEFRLQLLDFCDSMLVGGSFNYTHKGFLYISKRDSTALASNSAFICLFAANLGLRKNVYRKFSQQQLNYILGDGGQSFVVGYGKNSPKRPFHRASSCPKLQQRCSWTNRDSDADNPNELTGALVSGPDVWDNYIDDRTSTSNRVSIYSNAGFQTLAAGVLQIQVAMDTFSDPEPGELMPAILPKFDKHQDYGQVLRFSNMFYEAQKSGRLPPSTRIPWRRSACVNDKSFDGVDLSGGFFDGPDYIKFNFPMAFTTTVLSWGMMTFPESYHGAGEADALKSLLRWFTLYFMKCHTSKFELYGQVGSRALELSHWLRPEDITYFRPAYKITKTSPGTELAAETSAALSATAIVFKTTDEDYYRLLIKHAKELYQFADQYRGLYHRSIPDAGQSYPSFNGYKDELVWSSIWLYLATNETKYLRDATSKYQQFRMKNYAVRDFYWDDKLPAINVLLAKITKKKKYRTQAKAFCDNIIKHGDYTPKGLLYRPQWGTLQYASGAALICLMTADLGIKVEDNRKFAKKQIDYILGDGGGRSFVVGYGPMPPKQPYHRASSCPSVPNPCNLTALYSKEHNPHTLYGAVVGGPDGKDQYVDDRSNIRSNRVALTYNAAFQSAVAGLRYLEIFPPATPKPKIKSKKNKKIPKNNRSNKKSTTSTPAMKSTSPATTASWRTTNFTDTSFTSIVSATDSTAANTTPTVPATGHHLQLSSTQTIVLLAAASTVAANYSDVSTHASTVHGDHFNQTISDSTFISTNTSSSSMYPSSTSYSTTLTTGKYLATTSEAFTKTNGTTSTNDANDDWEKKRYCGRQRALELFDACAIPSKTFPLHEDSKIYRCRYRAFQGCVGVQTDNCADGVWTYWPYWNHNANDDIFFTVEDRECKDQRTMDIENCELSGMTTVFQECLEQIRGWNGSRHDAGKCWWRELQTCIDTSLDHCRRTWKMFEVWNIGRPAEEQFGKEDMDCETSAVTGHTGPSILSLTVISFLIISLYEYLSDSN